MKILVFICCCLLSIASKAQTEKELNTFMDNWHLAAATADADAYFNAFAEDGMFLGTDKSEVWNLAAFKSYSMPHFDKGKAWAFTATERNWYKVEDSRLVWFDEILDTHMGPCRGTGVLELVDGKPLIKHYSLSILVPNDLVKGYLELLNKD